VTNPAGAYTDFTYKTFHSPIRMMAYCGNLTKGIVAL